MKTVRTTGLMVFWSFRRCASAETECAVWTTMIESVGIGQRFRFDELYYQEGGGLGTEEFLYIMVPKKASKHLKTLKNIEGDEHRQRNFLLLRAEFKSVN